MLSILPREIRFSHALGTYKVSFSRILVTCLSIRLVSSTVPFPYALTGLLPSPWISFLGMGANSMKALWCTHMCVVCYSPYSFASHLSVFVLAPNSSSVGTILLWLVSLHVPCRIHFLFPLPFVTDPTPFSKLPTGRGLTHSSCLSFLMTYNVLSLRLSYLLSRFSRIGSWSLLLIRFHCVP
jgi:hypothetical protein